MLVRCMWQVCTAGTGEGRVSFLASLCCVGVAETHPCLHHQTGTRTVMDPPALAFIPSPGLLSSALVSAHRPVTPQKAELRQYRIPEPLILASRQILFPSLSWAMTAQTLRFHQQQFCFWQASSQKHVHRSLWGNLWKHIKSKQRPLNRKQGEEKEHSRYRTKFLAEI